MARARASARDGTNIRPLIVAGRGKARLVIPPPADPLLLLPLRLEYKVIEPGTIVVAKAPRARRKSRSRENGVAALAMTRLKRTGLEVWVRWYPDDVLQHEAPEAPSDREREALTEWEAVAGTGTWYDMADAGRNAAWQRLVDRIGFFRALHLVRNRNAPQSRRHAAGLVGTPERVALFTLNGTQLRHLGAGMPIAKEVSYGPEALAPGSWLSDFDRAVQDGMGLRLRGAAASQVLKADWLIACGIGMGNARAGVARYLEDRIAAGEFEFVAQDTPTNNSARANAGWTQWERDPVAALPGWTWLERRGANAPATDADVLAEAFGVPPAVLQATRGADGTDARAAVAMNTALLPGLTQFLDAAVAPEGVSADGLRAFLAKHVSARGPLPVVRLNHSPFGVLPITTPGALLPPLGSSPSERAAFSFLSRFSAATLAAFASRTKRLPVVRPGQGDMADTLRQILQTLPVSARVDVLDSERDPQLRRVTCQLVEGPGSPPLMPDTYLDWLLTRPLSKLPDPDSTQVAPPLLYRLLRLSLERVMAGVAASLRSLSATEALQQASTTLALRGLREWVEAVRSLRGRAIAELEVLLIEVLDLLDHRVDALQTGLATFRLRAMRSSGVAGLGAGWYGMLARPRREVRGIESDGYLQAPTVPQVETAGLLRSASLRQSTGAGSFDINLSSRRARKALRTLDALRRGLTLREILGYHAERWLHDRGQDALLHDLRATYSIDWGSDPRRASAALLDGERLLEAREVVVTQGSVARRQAMRGLIKELADQEDALADLVMAEGVHQLAHGNTSSVNAWMKVLSGSVPPDRVEFLRTHRAGHGSSYRLAYLTAVASAASHNPRAIAEPAVAELVSAHTDGFNRARIRATVTTARRAAPITRRVTLALHADLGLEPIDLLLGGSGEVMARARAYVLREWDAEFEPHLGPLPDRELTAFLNERMVLTLETDYRSGTAPTLDELMAKVRALGKVLSGSRPLTPADCNAGARAEVRGLTPDTLFPLLAQCAASLAARTTTLADQLAVARQDVVDARTALLRAAREVRRQDALPQPPSPAGRASLVDAVRARLADLNLALDPMLRFGIPDALAPLGPGEVIDGPEGCESRLLALEALLAAKRDRLSRAVASAQGPAATSVQVAEGTVRGLVEALQLACDGESLAVWPPFPMTDATRPDVGQARAVAAALGGWRKARHRVRDAELLGPAQPGLRARVTAQTPTTDARRPAVSYIGIHLLPDGDLPTGSVCGAVLDEWSDFRPATVQRTGIAINYDSPQGEPPHVLLLAVPPNDAITEWSEPLAAAVVQEAIRLMQVRALPAHGARYADLGFGAFNLVPPLVEGGRPRRRIPTPPKLNVTVGKDAPFGYEIMARTPAATHTAQSLNERRAKAP